MSFRFYATFSAVFFLLVFSCVPAAAAVISGGDGGGTSNLSAPADDPGWARVGWVGTNGSGVYLGNGWVITADHVSSKTYFTVDDDTTYNKIAGEANGVQLRNTADTEDIDLYMFRVDVSVGNLDGLGNLPIASAAPSDDKQGVHMGTGEGQTSSSKTTWYVDTDPPTWVWDTSDFPDSDITKDGYSWDGDLSRDTRWNYQHVYDSDWDFNGMEGFTTDFEEISDYGMVADNDSGSGFFVKNGTTWELAGVAHAIYNKFNGQPSSTGIFDNWSLYSDLSAYSDQISETVAIPEPAPLGLLLVGGLALLRRSRT